MKLFLPLGTLDEWLTSEQVDMADGKLQVRESKASVDAIGAVHFMKIVTGEDAANLVGRVKTEEQVKALGAEHMADSVILGEAAYEVATGYILNVTAPPPAKADPKKKAASPEADLLAAFILDKL
jgi:hypothetical protein